MNRYANRSTLEKKKIINHLNRITGQMQGVQRMIDEDRYCDDILIQLSAIDKSIKSLAVYILENHMYRCLSNELEKGNLEVVDEIVHLFRRFQS